MSNWKCTTRVASLQGLCKADKGWWRGGTSVVVHIDSALRKSVKVAIRNRLSSINARDPAQYDSKHPIPLEERQASPIDFFITTGVTVQPDHRPPYSRLDEFPVVMFP